MFSSIPFNKLPCCGRCKTLLAKTIGRERLVKKWRIRKNADQKMARIAKKLVEILNMNIVTFEFFQYFFKLIQEIHKKVWNTKLIPSKKSGFYFFNNVNASINLFKTCQTLNVHWHFRSRNESCFQKPHPRNKRSESALTLKNPSVMRWV